MMDERAVEDAVEAMLRFSGQDVSREGLASTPKRVAKFYREWLEPVAFEWTTFAAEGTTQMIVQDGIPVYSLCEHHLLPFVGHAVVAYLPDEKIVGLSKLARAVQQAARGFQNQERITNAVADAVMHNLAPKGCGVIIRAEHLCMTMRGAQAVGTKTLTCALRGAFQDDLMTRTEFMAWAGEVVRK
jgi:GTP cyclohydrolase I